MAGLYFGTKERMVWVKCPAIEADISRNNWSTEGIFLNGGAYVRHSAYSHKRYQFAWNLASHQDIYDVLDYADGLYGQDLIYFLDPFAISTNVLPLGWSVPRLQAQDAPPLIRDANRRPTLDATAPNNYAYPTQSAVFTLSDSDTLDSVYIPLPSGYEFHFGAHGSSTGTAAITVTPDQQEQYPSGLNKWRSALLTGSAQAVVIGDSISEGTGSTVITNRWQTVLQDSLRQEVGGPTGAIFPFIPSIPAASAPTGWPVTKAGAVVTSSSYGMGWRTAVLQDATQSVTFTFTGTSAKIMYVVGSITGVMNITVDGGTPVLVDTNSATAPPASNARTWSTGTLSFGEHTVTVTRDASSGASQYPYVQGLLTYNADEATGVRVLDASHSGYASSTLTTSRQQTASQAIAAAGVTKLAVIAFGTNDTVAPTTAAAYRANIEAMIARLRTDGFDGSVLLLNVYKGAGLDDGVYSQYGEQMAAIAEDDADVAYLNLRDYMPDVPTPYNDPSGLGYYADNLHPSDLGHAKIAEIVYDYIVPDDYNITLLPVDTGQLTNTIINDVTGVTISAQGVGNLTLAGMIGQVLPAGSTPPTGRFLSGRGHSGCTFAGSPSINGYSAPDALDKIGASATLIETGAWVNT